MPCKDKEKRKEYDKKWYAEHRDEKLAYCKKWHETHRDERKKYREQNKDKYRQWIKAWIKNHREQRCEIKRKSDSKRRSLGFVPLNEPFEGAEAHHIDKIYVIYIPEDIHHSIAHNVFTNKNMDEINAVAFNYL